MLYSARLSTYSYAMLAVRAHRSTAAQSCAVVQIHPAIHRPVPTSAEPNKSPVNIIQAEMYTAFVEMPDVMFQLQKRLLNVRLTFGARACRVPQSLCNELRIIHAGGNSISDES
jgi:hypothetical protein